MTYTGPAHLPDCLAHLPGACDTYVEAGKFTLPFGVGVLLMLAFFVGFLIGRRHTINWIDTAFRAGRSSYNYHPKD